MRLLLEFAVAQDGEDPNMAEIFPHLDYKPKLPQRMDHRIGIVGAGGIVNYAHLPAYKKAGFKVVAITDQNREKAERTAKEHGIEKVCASVEELLRLPEVEIVDIAVYPAQQSPLSSNAQLPENICCVRSLSRMSTQKRCAASNSPSEPR
jgi:hypothetical protein